MITVFEARTGFEAHMVSNLLQQARVDAKIVGEDLAGELPALGLVRVLVTPDNEAIARDIIADWDEAMPIGTANWRLTPQPD